MKNANSAVASVRTSARIGERNLVATGVGAVDVVETDGILRHDFQRVLAGLRKDFCIDGIAQRGDEAVDTGLDLIDDQAFRRRFRLGIDFDVIAAAAQQVDGFSNVAGGKDAKFVVHVFVSVTAVETKCYTASRDAEYRK